MVTTWLARVLRLSRRLAATLALNPETGGSPTTRSQSLGALGETMVAGELRCLGWPVLRNLVLSVRDRTVEIDAIVLLDEALMVLEVKTLSGLVVETEDVDVWERRGRTASVRFQSPLAQNRWHVDAVRQVVGDDRVMARGVVVSTGTARFSLTTGNEVVTLSQLSRLLGRPCGRSRPTPLVRAWVRLQDEARRSSSRRAMHRAAMEARAPAR